MKFGVEAPFSSVQIFERAVVSFVKERPREWVGFLFFWATRIESDQGFIEYEMILQHRDCWQEAHNVMLSKSTVASYCLELSKQLNLRYTAPSLPVELAMKSGPPTLGNGEADETERESGGGEATTSTPYEKAMGSAKMREIAEMFQSR